MVVADCNGFPVGQIFVLMSSAEGGIADGEARAYLYAFRVMEMFRGRGLGTRLIEEAETQVRARGFRWTTIAVAKTNTGAQRLYRRMGYQVFRDDPGNWTYTDHLGKKHYVHEPCWLLEKELDLH
jgi:ribosomal protein S18 acetylase RimI-like enzyme